MGRAEDRAANVYVFSSNNFEAALVALVQAFQRENPGISYACTMHDGTKVSIKMKPTKAPKGGK